MKVTERKQQLTMIRKAGKGEQVECPAEGCRAMLVADSVTRRMKKFHPDFDVKKADERPRIRLKCPMEDCKSITSRMKQHLENAHALKGSDHVDVLLLRAKLYTEEMRISERLDECLEAYQNAISGTTYEGRDIGETTAKSYVVQVKSFAQVKSFLPSFLFPAGTREFAFYG